MAGIKATLSKLETGQSKMVTRLSKLETGQSKLETGQKVLDIKVTAFGTQVDGYNDNE